MGAVACCRLALFRKALVIATALVVVWAAPAAAQKRAHDQWGQHQSGNEGDRDRHDDGRGAPGAFYTQTNEQGVNRVLVFKLTRDGKLDQTNNGCPGKASACVPTGGSGLAAQPPFGFPIVDSQGSVILADHGRLLFAVNAGSNTVTSFRVSRSGDLTLVDQKPSGGTLPISVTTHDALLYVLNEQSANISGLSFDHSGVMSQIPSSTRALTGGPGSLAAQVGFKPNGRVLIVTERCYQFPLGGCPGHPRGIIDVFTVANDGTPSAKPTANDPSCGSPQSTTNCAVGPFGFDFSRNSDLVLSNTGLVGNPPNPGDPAQFTGTASSYDVPNSGLVEDNGTISTAGRGACWTVVTKDGRYAFVTNSLSDSIPGSGTGAVARLKVSSDSLTLLPGNASVSSNPTGNAFATDLTLSSDNRFLFVVVPTLQQGNDTAHIDVFERHGGSLELKDKSADTAPSGISGAAAG